MLRNSDSRHRNMVSKGTREGLRVEWDEVAAWDEFAQLYCESMRRLNAPAALRFEPRYFAQLQRLPFARVAAVHSRGVLQAAACFFFGPYWAHYHLAARRPDSGNHVSSCILQAAFEQAAGAGLRGMHLGGGRTRAVDDDLLRFKLRTGGELRTFKVALVRADAAAYSRLCGRWAERNGRKPDWLLGYRQSQDLLRTP